jgi:hypothetical protein
MGWKNISSDDSSLNRRRMKSAWIDCPPIASNELATISTLSGRGDARAIAEGQS